MAEVRPPAATPRRESSSWRVLVAVQAAISLLIVCNYLALLWFRNDSPQSLEVLTVAVVTFYFGKMSERGSRREPS